MRSLLVLFLGLSPGGLGCLDGLRFGSILLCRLVFVTVAGGLVKGLFGLIVCCGEEVLRRRDVIVGGHVHVLGLGLRLGFVRIGHWFVSGFVGVQFRGLLLGCGVAVLILGLLSVLGLFLAGSGILLQNQLMF